MYTQEDIKKVQQRLLLMAKCIASILEANHLPYFIAYGTLLGAVRHHGFIPWDDDLDFYLFDEYYAECLEVLRESLPSDMLLEYKDNEPLYFHWWAHVKDLNSVTECELFPQDGVYAHHGVSVDLYRIKKINSEEGNLFRDKQALAYYTRRYQLNLLSKETFDLKDKDLTNKIKSDEENLLKIDLSQYPIVYTSVFDKNDYILPNELFPLVKYKFEDTEFYGPQNADVYLTRCYGDYMKLPPVEKRKPHYSSVKFL